MTLYQILTICGVGTASSLIITSIYNACRRKHEESKEEREARVIRWEEKLDALNNKIDAMDKHISETTDTAIQALLRNQLYELYNEWVPKAYAPTDVKENFENLYIKYHSLGRNGVMDGKHDTFMALPDIDTKEN